MAGLDVIHQAIRSCEDCNLHLGRTNAVPGEGSPHAEIMFIGEGPGYNEDKQARPFVGPAGQFLNELLNSIGLRREDVFIANMVKCRPPNNRDPFPGEIEACSHYLDEQIEAIKPRIIVPLGRYALARWFPNEAIGKLRAKPKRFGEITLFPLYHPAAALHNGGLRGTIEDDFAKLGVLLKDLIAGTVAPPSAAAPVAQFDIFAASPSNATPEPAAAPGPVAVPVPVADATPEPEATAAPADPEPIATPEPAAVPVADATPEPAAVPVADATPEPAAVPVADATPEPAAAPVADAPLEPEAAAASPDPEPSGQQLSMF